MKKEKKKRFKTKNKNIEVIVMNRCWGYCFLALHFYLDFHRWWIVISRLALVKKPTQQVKSKQVDFWGISNSQSFVRAGSLRAFTTLCAASRRAGVENRQQIQVNGSKCPVLTRSLLSERISSDLTTKTRKFLLSDAVSVLCSRGQQKRP